MHTQVQKLLIISLGCLLLSSGVVFFFSPNQIVTGGAPGIGILLFYVFQIPIGISVFIVNLSLMLLAAKRYGRGYFLRTLYAVLITSVFIETLTYLFPNPALTDKPYINVLVGSVMIGIGIAMCFMGDAASGGPATAAQMLSERTGIRVGRIIQMVDGTIVLLSAIVFENITSAFWAAIGVLLTGFMVDWYLKRRIQALTKGKKG